MEISRHWRMQGHNYLGKGSQPVTVVADEDHLRLIDQIKGRELNYNHGQAAGWGEALVTAMAGWGYTREYVERTIEGAAGQLNGPDGAPSGQGEVFAQAAEAAMEEIYGK